MCNGVNDRDVNVVYRRHPVELNSTSSTGDSAHTHAGLTGHSGMMDTLSRYWRKADKQAAYNTELLRGWTKEYVESIPREQMELGKK